MADDGTGDYISIKDAIEAGPLSGSSTLWIVVKGHSNDGAGYYDDSGRGVVAIPAALDFLLIEGVEQVTGRNPNTWTGFNSGGWAMDGWSTAGATDVTVRNLAIGGNATTDLHGAVSGSSASNWVYDWCSFWTPTNSVAGSVSGAQNIVFESCMIAAPLFSSTAPVANTTIVSNSYVANVSDGATTVSGGCYLFFANSTVNLSSTSLAINYASTLTQGTFYMAGCEIMFSGTGWAATLTNFASVTQRVLWKLT